MSPEKQRIAIARACGWVFIPSQAVLPDYLGDLNAIQSEWDSLGWEEKNAMVEHLKEIVKDASCEVYFATAAQRAEAFLKTLGLWEDEK